MCCARCPAGKTDRGSTHKDRKREKPQTCKGLWLFVWDMTPAAESTAAGAFAENADVRYQSRPENFLKLSMLMRTLSICVSCV